MHACALDVALDQTLVELQTLVHVVQGVGVAAEVVEGSAHVVCQSLELTQITDPDRLFERLACLLVALARPLLEGKQTLAHVPLAALFGQLGSVVEALWDVLGPEALEVVGDEGRAGELLVLGLENGAGLGLCNLLEEPLDSLGALVVAEAVNDAAGSVVEESLAVLVRLLVCVCAAVQRLDVFGVEADGGRGVVDDLFPVGAGIVASGAVRVEDGVRLAEDGLAVQVNGAVVVLGSVGLVSGRLELGRVVFPVLVREGSDGGLCDCGELVLGFD